MDKDFFDKWFEGFGEGLDKMSNEECSRFFQSVLIIVHGMHLKIFTEIYLKNVKKISTGSLSGLKKRKMSKAE